jgi:hypothetical protein
MTTERDEGWVERVRMRAYYLSLERGPTVTDDQNWIDAEVLERADEREVEPPPAAAPPPSIVEALPVQLPSPREALLARLPRLVAVTGGEPRGRFAMLLEAALSGAGETPLLQLEEALSLLARRLKPAELAAAARGLADPTADALVSELRWDVATSELAVLATLEGAGRLVAIGAPPGFSCTLGAKKVSVAVQTRPALGSGFWSLRQLLLREAGDDATERALVLRAASAAKSPAPGELERLPAVAREAAAAFSVGELTFDWLSAEAAEGSTTLVQALLPGFKREIELAAKGASADPERELPFLLAEVVLPASPGEPLEVLPGVREAVAKKVAAGAARLGYSAGFSWLGFLRVDWRSPEPRRTLFVRPAANWPLSYRDLGAELGASVVVL